ncbi:hypothetical protein BD310DRAFT_693277 [Dichomitus squalens]|uniref:Uncharacterized protein n=1 Tax=Dichomitus squalens TaxID=114155 RepID=A0A4Q9PM89_9APHY|nr:hypothetical protein BD310DRAFT_693277 [Dichomitus squalens]
MFQRRSQAQQAGGRNLLQRCRPGAFPSALLSILGWGVWVRLYVRAQDSSGATWDADNALGASATRRTAISGAPHNTWRSIRQRPRPPACTPSPIRGLWHLLRLYLYRQRRPRPSNVRTRTYRRAVLQGVRDCVHK